MIIELARSLTETINKIFELNEYIGYKVKAIDGILSNDFLTSSQLNVVRDELRDVKDKQQLIDDSFYKVFDLVREIKNYMKKVEER